MLQVTDVSKCYPTPRGPIEVLAEVSFSLAPGEAAAITGPSGSGKTSLLCILGALDAPSSGTVTLDGCDPFALAPDAMAEFRNAQIGFVFQDHCLLPQCSVLENVLVPTLVARRPRGAGPVGPAGDGPAEDMRRAQALVEQVGLADRIEHRPAALSGGEKQRVAIARALVRQPRLVLCDEPTGNLDQATAAAVAALLVDLHRRQQNILIVVTHSERLAAQFPVRFEIADKRLRRVP
jgi:lipoprotein-releasing system ATP-binding protein